MGFTKESWLLMNGVTYYLNIHVPNPILIALCWHEGQWCTMRHKMPHLSSEDRMTAPACSLQEQELSGALASVFQALYSYLTLPVLVCLLFCLLWTPKIFDCMRGPQCNFFKQSLRCSPPSPCLLLSGRYRQHWAITLHHLGCGLGDLGSSCSSVSLTHQTYSQMS